jgi:hypothetical protein
LLLNFPHLGFDPYDSPMPYPQFDRSKLLLKPLTERVHDMSISDILPLEAEPPPFENEDLPIIAERIVAARRSGHPVILLMGAHVIKTGLSRFVIEWIKRGVVNHVAMNGAGPIHDFELALLGATTESVARYIQEGQFGLWRETGGVNDAVREGAALGMGYGEAVGRAIEEGDFPYRDVSVLAAGYRLHVPVTVHVGIGYDITHEQPNCDGAAIGEASYRDFLIFAQSVSQLQGGVLLNFGSAVMGPEVYLKALAMARNVARQENRRINEFATAVFDLVELGEDLHHEAPKSEARYYYRPFKTILVRTVADGGESYYVRGPHQATLPNLFRLVETHGIPGQGA